MLPAAILLWKAESENHFESCERIDCVELVKTRFPAACGEEIQIDVILSHSLFQGSGLYLLQFRSIKIKHGFLILEIIDSVLYYLFKHYPYCP